jgi:starch phosphorylase
LRAAGHSPRDRVRDDPALKAVLDAIAGGRFSPDEPGRYRLLVDSLLGSDHYLLLADYAVYVATQARVDATYADPDAWFRHAVHNVAGMGPFSADRTIAQYAREIWRVSPAPSTTGAAR